ncbi:MAG: hypothetical protein MJ094_08325 [Saccharofermentans sp.]|nr:hypothetical protein [Saccharofermentans sp.]
MKMKKIVAVALTLSMVIGIAGCSKSKKITTDSFVSVVESMGASEVKFSKLNRVDQDDIEEGVYSQFDGSDIEDMDGYEAVADRFDFPFEAEDIVSGAVYVRATNFDVEEPEDLEDAEIDAIIATQITLSEDMSDDVIEYYADLLDMISVDIDDLSDEEYSEKDGTLRINVDVEDLVARIPDLSIFQLLMAFSEEDVQNTINDVIDNASGNVCLGVYVNGESVVVVIGVGYGVTPELVGDLCSDLGLESPLDVDANSDIANGIMDMVEDEIMNAFSSIGF